MGRRKLYESPEEKAESLRQNKRRYVEANKEHVLEYGRAFYAKNYAKTATLVRAEKLKNKITRLEKELESVRFQYWKETMK